MYKGGENYRQSPSEDKTEGGSTSAKKSINFLDVLFDLGNLRLPKMVLILLFAEYAVIAFSKGNVGVINSDFKYFVGLSLFSIVIFLILVLLQAVWVAYKRRILRMCKNFLKL